MNTIELQNNIIRQILEIDDDKFLGYLNALLQNDNVKEVYKTSDFEKAILAESMKEYTAGNTIDHDEMFKKNEKWFEE